MSSRTAIKYIKKKFTHSRHISMFRKPHVSIVTYKSRLLGGRLQHFSTLICDSTKFTTFSEFHLCKMQNTNGASGNSTAMWCVMLSYIIIFLKRLLSIQSRIVHSHDIVDTNQATFESNLLNKWMIAFYFC